MGLSVNTTTMAIGVRRFKEVTIYPLSMADEIKLTNTIAKAFQQFQALKLTNDPNFSEDKLDDDDYIASVLSKDDEITPEAIVFIIKVIEENLLDILKMVCEEEVTLNDLTNDQFADLCHLIYDMNFAGTVGKFQSLLKKIRSSFQQTKPSPNLSSPPVTE